MQTFKDTVDDKYYQFNDDVKVVDTAGVYTFFTSRGLELTSTPTTLIPGVMPAAIPKTADELLDDAHKTQNESLLQSYLAAISAPLSFTSAAGVVKTYQTDGKSRNVLAEVENGYQQEGAVPAGFFWVSSDNSQVPFALSDLSGLYSAILARGWSNFKKLQGLKANVMAATTISDVQAITW